MLCLVLYYCNVSSFILSGAYIPQMHTNTHPAFVIQHTHVPSDHTLLIPTSIPADVTIHLEKYSVPFYAPFTSTVSEVFKAPNILECRCEYQPALILFWVHSSSRVKELHLISTFNTSVTIETSHYHSVYDKVTMADECKWICLMTSLSISRDIIHVNTQFPQCHGQELMPLEYPVDGRSQEVCSYTKQYNEVNSYLKSADTSMYVISTESHSTITTTMILELMSTTTLEAVCLITMTISMFISYIIMTCQRKVSDEMVLAKMMELDEILKKEVEIYIADKLKSIRNEDDII